VRIVNMKMNKDYVEQIYRSSLERTVMAIMQESFGNCAEELLRLQGRSGKTLLDDIIEDENGDICVSIGHVLAGRLRELEDIGKDRPVPEGQKSWTICISNSEGYPASFMHFEGTAEEVQTALLQLAAEDRAKAPDEYECGSDPEDIGALDDGFYDMHVAYKDYRIDYAIMEDSRIEELSRDILTWEVPPLNKEPVTDRRFEVLKDKLFAEGTDAIGDFLGGEWCGDMDGEAIDALMDSAYEQMSEEELEEFIMGITTHIADRRFEALKVRLFQEGSDAIEDFLGYEFLPIPEDDTVENALDDAYAQMSDGELEEFYRKYNIPEQDEDIER
jgi:hypothetical protein